MADSSPSYLVLGPLFVRIGDDARTPTANKHRLLLARLLLSPGQTLSVDELTDALWNECAPASARKLIQLYVHELREVLGRDALETDASGYRLDIDPEAIDSVRFERLASEGRVLLGAGRAAAAAPLLRSALELWRGPAYADVRYENFVRIEAERLDEVRLACLEARLQAEAALGESEGAIAELGALVAEHPDRETLRGALMVAHYRAGRQADALEVYEEGRAFLDAELGLEPSPGLRELQRQILNHDPALEPVLERTARRLPVAQTSLRGRDHDVATLAALLERDDVRLLTIAGAGGIGKSRLALELAHRCGESFADGVVLVELAHLHSERHVGPHLLEAVGAPEARDAPAWEALERFLADRELLLVVDNAEHLAQVGPKLAALTRAAPRLTVVTTSRRVLHVSGEQVYLVAPLEPKAAVDLFLERAEAVAPGYGDAADATVAKICARLDNLPLALELAAARALTLTPPALLDRLDDRLGLLVDGPRDLPDRQRTLHETLRWSSDLLTDGERSGFARLGPFTGGCTLTAAETAARLSLSELQALVASSLVTRTVVDGQPRFTMLETVREYALELLGEERSAVERIHAAFYADLAMAYQDFLESDSYDDGAQQSEWLRTLDTEISNLRAALDWSVAAGESTLALGIAGGLWRYWHVRGQLADGLDQIERALDVGRTADPHIVSVALVGAAGLAWGAGRRALASAYATQAIHVAPDDLHAALAAENVLGVVAAHDRDYEVARRHHERSRDIAIQLGAARHEMTAAINLGDIAYAQGDYAQATQHWQTYLTYWSERGSEEGVGLGTLNLGLAALRTGDLDAADQLFAEALACFQSINFREHIGHALVGQAAVAALRTEPDRAAALLSAARQMLDDVGASPETFDPTLADEIDAMLLESEKR